jgi:hypothetical protein
MLAGCLSERHSTVRGYSSSSSSVGACCCTQCSSHAAASSSSCFCVAALCMLPGFVAGRTKKGVPRVSAFKFLQVWSGSPAAASCGGVLCVACCLQASVCLLFLQHAVCCASAQFLLPTPSTAMPLQHMALWQHRAGVTADMDPGQAVICCTPCEAD